MPHKTTFVRCGRHDIARAVERLGGLHHLTTALGYSNPRPAGAGATQWQAHVSKVAAVTKLSGKQVRGRGGFLAAMHVLAVPPPGSGRDERAPGPTALTLPPPTGAVSRGSMHIRQGAQGRRAGPGGERGVVAGRSRRSAPGRWGPQRAGFPWCRFADPCAMNLGTVPTCSPDEARAGCWGENRAGPGEARVHLHHTLPIRVWVQTCKERESAGAHVPAHCCALAALLFAAGTRAPCARPRLGNERGRDWVATSAGVAAW